MWQSGSSNRGASLIEVMVATIVLGIVIVGVTRFNAYTSFNKRKLRIKLVQESIGRMIESQLKNPAALYYSLTHMGFNKKMIECVLGSGSGCTLRNTRPAEALNPNNDQRQFALIFVNQSLGGSTIAENLDVLSSAPPQMDYPQYYDVNGKHCFETDNCIFEVKTYWYASCPTVDLCNKNTPSGELRYTNPNIVPPESCQCGAAELFVAYQVVQVESEKWAGGKTRGAKLKPFPRDDQITFHRLAVQDILGATRNSDCNPGAVIKGYTANGQAICRCAQPFVLDASKPSNRRGQICALTQADELQCPDGQIFKGLEPDGTARCFSRNQAYVCDKSIKKSISTHRASDMNAAEINENYCPPNYRLHSFRKSNCKFYCLVGKGGTACSSTEGPVVLKYEYENGISEAYRGARVYGRYQNFTNVQVDGFSASDRNKANAARNREDGTDPIDEDDSFWAGQMSHGLVCDELNIKCCRHADTANSQPF